MKKLTSMLLALALALSLAACGGAASSSVASSAASSEAVPEAASEAASSEEAKELSTTDALRIAGLKGPTTMGLVNLLSMEEDGTASMDYDLQLYGAADEGRAGHGCHPGKSGRHPVSEDGGRHSGCGRQHAGRAVRSGKRRRYDPVHGRPCRPYHPVHRQGHHAGVRAALSSERQRHRPGQGRDH